MANRSYLYSLSNRPTAYADRPETISGLSEWAYDVPFSFRVLLSGEPQLCASLVSNGFDGDPEDQRTKLYAIRGEFEAGFSRLRRFVEILRPLVVSASPALAAGLDGTLAFLEAHRDRYLLLETVELDTMTAETGEALAECVRAEVGECGRAGAAIDALPADAAAAGALLLRASREEAGPPFDALFGLRLDDRHDDTRDGSARYPLGLDWCDELYFALSNKADFEASR